MISIGQLLKQDPQPRGCGSFRWGLTIFGLLVLASPVSAQDWPQWRGPTGQGTTKATNLPGGKVALRWKTPAAGEGCSSPIVRQGRVYLTTAYKGEEPHPWDECAALFVMILGGCVSALTICRLPAVIRSVAGAQSSTAHRPTQRVLFGVFCLAAVLAGALTTIILARPKLFWQFPDVWSGTDLAHAELEFVDTFHLRPIIVLFVGSMSLIFTNLTMSAYRETSPGENRPLSRWLAVVTLCCTLFPAVAAALIGWQPEWFFASGQPWLAWMVAGGLGLLGLAGSIGWLAERSVFRPLLAGAGLGAAVRLFCNTPTNEFAIPLDPRIEVAYVLPGSLLCVCHLVVFLLARRPVRRPEVSVVAAPADAIMVAPPADAIMSARPSVPPAVSRVSFLTTVMAWLPFLMAVQAATLFARSNYLLPEAGMVRAVLCFDAKSGELLWKTPVYVDVAEKKHSFNSHATPTPACDEDGVYAYFGSGLAALDRSGRVRWLLRDPDFHRHSRYGTGSSVVLAGEWLIVYNDSEFQGHGGHHLDDNVEGQQGRRQSHLTAVNKKTGERRWSVSPAYSHDSYMTPLVWERDGELEVVIATWKTLAGFALKDGSQRWTHGYPMQQIVPSLAVNDDCLFVTGGNFQPYPVHAIRPATFDTVWTVSKGGGNIVSPVCWEGQLYTVNHAGFLFCRDADSGRFRWQTRLGGRCRRRCPPATARSSSSIRREHCTSWTRNRATCWLSLPWKRTARRRPPWRTAASLSGPTNTSAAWRANEYSKVPIFALSP